MSATHDRFAEIIQRYLPPLPVNAAEGLLANARSLVAASVAHAARALTDHELFQIAGIAVSRGYYFGISQTRATVTPFANAANEGLKDAVNVLFDTITEDEGARFGPFLDQLSEAGDRFDAFYHMAKGTKPEQEVGEGDAR